MMESFLNVGTGESLTAFQWLLAGGAVTIGATLQGSVGFGLGMVASPILILINPAFVPAPLLLCSLAMTLLIAYREHQALHVGDVTWALVGRVPGIVLGVGTLVVVSAERLAIVFGFLILAAAIMSAIGPRFVVSRRALCIAGAVSGFMGTTISVGGPAIALVLQNQPGGRVRATLSGYFAVGVSMSLVALAAVGRLGRTELFLAAALLPGTFMGLAISRRLAPVLDRGRTRLAVVSLSFVAGCAVLVRYVLLLG
jgi:uncharacterized protein